MNKKKVLIITYYWPPAGGAGVQRWMKMSKYFNEFESSLKSKCEIIPAKNRNNAGIIGAATCFK